MRALIQRVNKGEVIIKDEDYRSTIGKGLVILLGVNENDSEEDADYLAGKCVNMRIFEDDNEKMNLSLNDVGGELLVISQFTLYAETRKGNRPSFVQAAKRDKATHLYEYFVAKVKGLAGENRVKTGIFGAMMEVRIFNDGPVTILAESEK